MIPPTRLMCGAEDVEEADEVVIRERTQTVLLAESGFMPVGGGMVPRICWKTVEDLAKASLSTQVVHYRV